MGLLDTISSVISGGVNAVSSAVSSGISAAGQTISSLAGGSGSSGSKNASPGTTQPTSSGSKSAGADYSGKQVSTGNSAVAQDASYYGLAQPYISKVDVKKSAGADYSGTQVVSVENIKKSSTQGITTYAPWGNYAAIELLNTKITVSKDPGEVGVYQLREGRSGSGPLDWLLVSSGGRAAVQSGAYTVVYPETPVVYTQYNKEPTLASSANATEAAKVLTNPEKYSRLGSEAYGGYVLPLDNRTVESTGAQLSTYANPYNLANLVNPQGVNLSKSEAPGANVPWAISGTAPVISSMGPGGLGGELILPALVTTTTIKTPFISTVDIERINTQLTKTTTEPAFGIMGLTLAAQGATGKTPASTGTITDLSTALDEYHAEHGSNFVLTGGLLGRLAFGEKAPEVMTGALASAVDFVTGWVGWTPGKDALQTTKSELTTFRSEKSELESKLKSLESYGKSTFGVNAAGEITIPEGSKEGQTFKTEYESALSQYNALMLEAKTSGVLTYDYKTGGYVENPEKTLPYGEFSAWSYGAGKQVRESLGITKEQLDIYGLQIKDHPGVSGYIENLVYGTGYKLSTNPGEVITGYIGGAALVLTGSALGDVVGTLAAGSGRVATAATTIQAITESRAFQYGVPLVFAGMIGYSASEGLTATPQMTARNLGEMLPELGAAVYGGASGFAALRLADAGYIGFGTRQKVSQIEKPKTEVIDLRETVDLTGLVPETTIPIESIPVVRVMDLTELSKPLTRAERSMIISQYQLTPEEISLAKSQKYSLNDLLAYREKTMAEILELQTTSQLAAPVTKPSTIQVINLDQLLKTDQVVLQETVATESPEVVKVINLREIAIPALDTATVVDVAQIQKQRSFVIPSIVGTMDLTGEIAITGQKSFSGVIEANTATLDTRLALGLADISLSKTSTKQSSAQVQSIDQATLQSVSESTLTRDLQITDIALGTAQATRGVAEVQPIQFADIPLTPVVPIEPTPITTIIEPITPIPPVIPPAFKIAFPSGGGGDGVFGRMFRPFTERFYPGEGVNARIFNIPQMKPVRMNLAQSPQARLTMPQRQVYFKSRPIQFNIPATRSMLPRKRNRYIT